MRTSRVWRIGLATLGLALLTGGTAFAEDQVGDPQEVAMTVMVEGAAEPGLLYMTVAGNAVTLNETTSLDPALRLFTGSLPDVTVTDTRDPGSIDPGVYWSVVGTAADFVGDAGQDAIPAGRLGWEPLLADDVDPLSVYVGPKVLTTADSPTSTPPDNVGLVDQELLAIADNSAGIASEGSWTASANLFLKADSDVEPGTYVSTLTLSLFE
jgi:hypothetical protein